MRNDLTKFLLGEVILAALIICYAIITHAGAAAALAGVAVASGINIAGWALWIGGERLVRAARQ